MNALDRRHFVKLAGTAALLGTTPASAKELALRAARPVQPTVVNWLQFRAEMKRRQQPGVLVLLQPLPKEQLDGLKKGKADAKAAFVPVQTAGNELALAAHGALFSCGNSEMPLLLMQAVFMAAPIDQARKEFPTLPANAGLALVDADGKVLRSLPITADLATHFIQSSAELIYGKEGDLLAQRVQAERAALGAATCQKLDDALIKLDDDDFGNRQEASQVLTDLFPKIPAALMQTYRNAPSLEVRVRIDSLFRKKLHDEKVADLLQGSVAFVSGFGRNVRVECGQGALPPRAHEFVQRWSQC